MSFRDKYTLHFNLGCISLITEMRKRIQIPRMINNRLHLKGNPSMKTISSVENGKYIQSFIDIRASSK